MEKIRLEIIGLSYSQTQSGAYALVLGEAEGKRRLPIIIGGFEAQAIAIELEKMTPSRPLTHDLFKSFSAEFDIDFREVIIYNLVEGIFYAKIVCEKDGRSVEIDARTSDAIAIAVRFNCPVYTYEFLMSSAGIVLDESLLQDSDDDSDDELEDDAENEMVTTGDLGSLTQAELEKKLEDAIEREDYETASRIRDELNNRSKN
jgi:uncharacterized protein